MKRLLVKVCGITTKETAEALVCFEPDMIGLVFACSPRKVTLQRAREIAKIARKKQVRVVAVFQNQPLDEILQTVALINIDYVQLHGDEPVEFCKKISVKIIKAIKLKTSVDETKKIMESYKPFVDLFLVDRIEQGRGGLVDLKQVKELAGQYPILLAGGLNPENIKPILAEVGDVIRGVDVSGGVEKSAGIKDLAKVKSFITKVRGY